MAEVMPAQAHQEPVPLDTIPISPAYGTNGEIKKSEDSGYSETVTVFHDPDNFNVKHPLMNSWTLWFTKPPSGKVRRTHYTTA